MGTMLSLADTQALIRAALVDDASTNVRPILVGGHNPARRLAIHQRQYESSLVAALLGKFPATAWLVGRAFVEHYARVFVHERPPQSPCIAEYGADFPEFVSVQAGSERVPYLRAFAELEWAVGAVSIAVEQTPVGVDRLSNLEATALPDVRLTLQSGLQLLGTDWSVDDLFKMYLTDTAQEEIILEPGPVWLQVRGSRGTFRVDRLGKGDFLFRQAIANGESTGDAAARALERGLNFDPGAALSAVFGEGLVTAIVTGMAQAVEANSRAQPRFERA